MGVCFEGPLDGSRHKIVEHDVVRSFIHVDGMGNRHLYIPFVDLSSDAEEREGWEYAGVVLPPPTGKVKALIGLYAC